MKTDTIRKELHVHDSGWVLILRESDDRYSNGVKAVLSNGEWTTNGDSRFAFNDNGDTHYITESVVKWANKLSDNFWLKIN
tara:strand:+ start:550 stop:792 length:243 start_codon:yes stop_codon:yes gene_type:complete